MLCIICEDPNRTDLIPLNCCAASNNVICRRCYDLNPNRSICPHCQRSVRLLNQTKRRCIFKTPSCDDDSEEAFIILTWIFSIIPFLFQIANLAIHYGRYSNDDFVIPAIAFTIFEIIIFGAILCGITCSNGDSPKEIKIIFGIFLGVRIFLESAGTVALSVIRFHHTWEAVLVYCAAAYGVYVLILLIAILVAIFCIIKQLWCCTVETQSTIALVSNSIPDAVPLPQSYKSMV